MTRYETTLSLMFIFFWSLKIVDSGSISHFQVLREMVGSNELVAEIDKEWEQLKKDRESLRQVFPKGNNGKAGFNLPCNLDRMIWNAQKIFHINERHPTDLNPIKVIQGELSLHK